MTNTAITNNAFSQRIRNMIEKLIIYFIYLSSLVWFAISSERSVAVIGATGRVGKACIQLLKAQGFNMNLLVRKDEDISALRQELNLNDDYCKFIKGNVLNMDSLKELTKNCEFVLDVHGMKPPRFTKLTDLFNNPASDPTHPYNVNYIGVNNVIEAMKVNNVRKIVRITGATVGKSPFSPFRALFAILLSMSGKYHELAEISIRNSGFDYSVIRPTGIVNEPSAASQNRLLILSPGDGNEKLKIPAKISVVDLADLIVFAMTSDKFQKTTAICSSKDNSENVEYESWSQLTDKKIQRDFKTLSVGPYTLAVSFYITTVSLIVGGIFKGIWMIGSKLFR